jgi:hypothetical protein
MSLPATRNIGGGKIFDGAFINNPSGYVVLRSERAKPRGGIRVDLVIERRGHWGGKAPES